MATYKSPRRLARAMKAKAKALVKNMNSSTHDASAYMIAQARSMAPVGKGDTIRGIRKWKIRDGHRVESRVDGEFKQNIWANQGSGNTRIGKGPFYAPRMIWNHGTRVYDSRKRRTKLIGGMPTPYGDGSHITTGEPGFWRIASFRTKKMFRKLVRRNTNKALRVTV